MNIIQPVRNFGGIMQVMASAFAIDLPGYIHHVHRCARSAIMDPRFRQDEIMLG